MNTQSTSSLNVITGLKSGSRVCFERIYLTYRDRVFYYVLKLTKCEEMSHEIVQDVFIKIWMYREKIDTDYSFTSFLFKVAHNHSINVLKRVTYEKKVKDTISKTAVGKVSNTEDHVVYNNYMDIMSEAVQELPPRRKSIFEMSRGEGISHDEIAENLGISKNTVKSQLVKATKSIRNYFAVNAGMSF